MYKLSDEFSHRIVGAFGEDGADWLHSLPRILDDLTSRWKITIKDPFQDMAYNFVAPAIREDSIHVVVKAGVPNLELENEIAALRAFDGYGAVTLIEALPEQGVFLLEQLRPGEPVLHLKDDETATSIASEVMRHLWKSGLPDGDFPSVTDWADGLQKLRERFDGGTGPFPKKLIETTEVLFRDLLSSMDEATLLHGDLHHWNILSAEREPWLAIDPKGVVGEPAYEVGAWLRNPFPNILTFDHPKNVITRRLDQFAEHLMLDRDRLLAWGISQAVLAAWWSFDDDDENWSTWIKVAEVISTTDN
jgi:streptomycin 6-kinase